MAERMRYESEEQPGGNSLRGAASKDEAWMGAFERVLGDHGDGALDAERRGKGSDAAAGRLGQQSVAADAGGKAHLRDAANADALGNPGGSQSRPRFDERSRTGSAAALISAQTSQRESMHTSPSGAASSGWVMPGPPPRGRSRSGSQSSETPAPPPSSSPRPLLAPPRVSHGNLHEQLAPSSHHRGDASMRTATPSGYSLAPPPSGQQRNAQKARSAASRSHGDDSSEERQSGPSLVAVSESSIELDGVYVNHAPSITKLVLRNLNDGKRTLVRIESDLGRGLSFLKRKRSVVPDSLEAIHWPANTTSWARADGLSPPKLRDLRHFGANLETADSFILEPGAEMPLFVSFRAAHFVADGEARWQPPRSPTIESAPGSPPLPRAREGTLASRSSSNSSAATSPSGFAGTNTLQQQQLATPQTPVADMMAFSPRSAPELSSTFEAGPGASPVHRGFEVRGMVTLRAWTMPAAAAQDTAGAEELSLAADKASAPSAAKSWASTSSSSRPGSLYGSHVSSAHASSTTDTSVSTDQEGAGQVTTLPFWAYSCRPQLAVSSSRATPTHRHLEEDSLAPTQPHVHGLITLDFGDIFVGQSDEREITLLNQSDIEVFWQARLDDADSMLAAPPLSLVDSETGALVQTVSSSDEVQSRPHIVAACTAQTLRVALLPREPCRDFEQVISFSNLHNASNTVRVLVRANMLGAATDDALAVLSGDSIDFGDCCGGHWTRQLLVLKNNGDHILDVAFSVQRGVEANFQLAELAPQIEEISSDDLFMEPPPPAASSGLPSRHTDSEPSNASSSRSDATSSAMSHEGWRLLSPKSGHDTDDEDAANSAAELAKTPTHHALTTSAPDPPPLQLAEVTPQPGERGSIKACTPLGLPTKRQSDDDVDASSVASQAGSTPGSPMQVRNKFAAEPSAGGSAVESGDEADGEAQQTARLRPQPSSEMLFAPHPTPNHQRKGTSTNEDVVSLRSEVTTATSQESRIGGSYAATSSQHSGPSRTSARIGGGSGVALRGLRSVEQAHSNQLEELVLRPGAEYRVVVAYRPQRGQADEHFSAGRLREDTFNISLDYARARADGARSRGGRQRKTVLCRLRTCTSFITVSPQLIDFGEANVGARKSAHIAVENRSELTARIDVRFVSKVLSMYRDEVAIPALQTVELRVDFFPRRINEAYRKQITVANLMNRTDDQIFEVRAKNVDRQRVSFHSLFYRILTASGANFIDFGDVNINSTRVRTFSIENISGGRLALELSAAHPEDLRLFVKAAPARESAPDSETAAPDATDRPRTPKKATEADGADTAGAPKVAALEVPGKSKTGVSGADLKERFLETISVDSPASIRRENASWRLAQKHSHVRAAKDANSKAAGNAAGKDPAAAPKPKAPINMVSALKKGGKGRISLQWGRSMTFKDRKILSDFEYLDLATGPPVDARRISVKSKKYQTLETLEMGERSTRSTPAGSKLNVRASRAEQSANDAAPGDVGSGSISKSATTKKSRPSVSSRKLASGAAADAKEPPATPAASDAQRAKVAAAAATADGGDAESACNKSPALTGKRKPQASSLSNPASVSKLTLDELIAAVEAQSSTLSAFFMGSAEAEERAVRTEINLQRELQAAISSGRLVPVDLLALEEAQERQVVAVYTPVASTRPHIQGNSRKQDSRIFLRLAQFNDAVVRASEEFSSMADLEIDELPVRDLMVRSTLCRSLLELGQPHINFGHMEKGDSKARKILIQNRSEWALRYCIRKSGSIASGDIKIASGLYGIVPGHGKREVDFLFSPSLTGQFQEKLVVENVADRERDQTVSLKATVRKVPNFAVEPASLDFGVCQPGKLTRAEGFVVTNTTAKARTFVVAVDSDELRHQRSIVDVVIAAAAATEGSVRGTLSKAEEEEVEHISQKLKIATRKGHTDKVKKYETRLTELGIKTPSSTDEREAGASEDTAAPEPDAPAPPPAPDAAAPVLSPEEQAARLKRTASSAVTIGIAAGQSKRLLIRLRPHAVHTALDASQSAAAAAAAASAAPLDADDVTVRVQIHEVKNRDETRFVDVRARVEMAADAGSSEAEAKLVDPLPRDDSIVFSSSKPS